MRWSWQRTRFVREVVGLMRYLNWAKWGGREQSQTQGNSSLITLVSTYFDEASHQPSNPSNPSQIITNPWIFGWIVIDQDTPPRPSTCRVGRELRRGAINSDWSRAFSSLNTSRWRFRCFSDAGVRASWGPSNHLIFTQPLRHRNPLLPTVEEAFGAACWDIGSSPGRSITGWNNAIKTPFFRVIEIWKFTELQAPQNPGCGLLHPPCY